MSHVLFVAMLQFGTATIPPQAMSLQFETCTTLPEKVEGALSLVSKDTVHVASADNAVAASPPSSKKVTDAQPTKREPGVGPLDKPLDKGNTKKAEAGQPANEKRLLEQKLNLGEFGWPLAGVGGLSLAAFVVALGAFIASGGSGCLISLATGLLIAGVLLLGIPGAVLATLITSLIPLSEEAEPYDKFVVVLSRLTGGLGVSAVASLIVGVLAGLFTAAAAASSMAGFPSASCAQVGLIIGIGVGLTAFCIAPVASTFAAYQTDLYVRGLFAPEEATDTEPQKLESPGPTVPPHAPPPPMLGLPSPADSAGFRY